jgi:hypothetical protein
MADTTYTLPEVVIKGETYTFQFISPISGLTTPTQNLLVSMGNRKEKIETDIPEYGAILPEQIDLEFKDKFGFFEALLADDFDVKIIRSPDIIEIYGHIVTDEPIEMEETYVSTTKARKNVKLSCISFIDKLKDVSVESVLARIAALQAFYYDVQDPGQQQYNILVNDLFGAFLEIGFGTTHELAKPIIPNNDFKYYRQGSGTVSPWDELGICMNFTALFNIGAWEYYLGNMYENAMDLLVACAASFGFIPRIYYDSTNAAWRMQLITRRKQAYTAVAAPTRFVPGKKYTKAYGPKNYKFYEDSNSQHILHEAWTTPDETVYEGIASNIDFDIETRILFNAGIDLTHLEAGSPGYADRIFTIAYYDYHDLAWVVATLKGNGFLLSPEAHLRYYKAQRDYQKEYFERTFKGFTENYISTVLVMHNGIENKDYYINSFERNYGTKEEFYELIEV